MKKPFLYLIFLSLLACNKPDKDFLQFVYSDMEKSNRAFTKLTEDHYAWLIKYMKESPCGSSPEEIEILDSVNLRFRQQINDINYLINYFGASKIQDTFFFEKRKLTQDDLALLKKLNMELLQTIKYIKEKIEHQILYIDLNDSLISLIQNCSLKSTQIETLNYLLNIKIQLLHTFNEHYFHFNDGCIDDSRPQAFTIAERRCIKKGDTLKMNYYLGNFIYQKHDVVFRDKYFRDYDYQTELISTSKEKGPHSDKGYIIIKEGRYQGEIIPFKIDYYVQ
jgi:hypothetical protein